MWLGSVGLGKRGRLGRLGVLLFSYKRIFLEDSVAETLMELSLDSDLRSGLSEVIILEVMIYKSCKKCLICQNLTGLSEM